ncbi:MAG: hypothetical protein HY903_24600 [Deltaproteobacteria bacterium]|nr:hypothetical protein [Deltaproteobacteria bacterium]
MTDPRYCGGCFGNCGSNALCVASSCRAASAAWTPLPDTGGTVALHGVGHDLASDGARLFLAVVSRDNGGLVGVNVAHYAPALSTWSSVGPTIAPALDVKQSAALFATPTELYLAYGSASTIHVTSSQDLANWSELAPPGLASPCVMYWAMDLLVAAGVPHVAGLGSGGCGIGVMVASAPSGLWLTPGGPTVTMNGNGAPALVATDRVYVAVAERTPSLPSIETWSARYFSPTPTPGAWLTLDGSLSTITNSGAMSGPDGTGMALVADRGQNLFVAWAEPVDATTMRVRVATHGSGAAAWAEVGVAPATGGQNARAPSLALIGDNLWLSHLVAESGVEHVQVRMFDRRNSAWMAVGGNLDASATDSAVMPGIVGVGGVPYVVFRQGPAATTGTAIVVVRFTN